MYWSNWPTIVREIASSSRAITDIFFDRFGKGLKEISVFRETHNLGAMTAFDQHFHGAIR